jgi:hypothetical protein
MLTLFVRVKIRARTKVKVVVISSVTFLIKGVNFEEN